MRLEVLVLRCQTAATMRARRPQFPWTTHGVGVGAGLRCRVAEERAHGQCAQGRATLGRRPTGHGTGISNRWPRGGAPHRRAAGCQRRAARQGHSRGAVLVGAGGRNGAASERHSYCVCFVSSCRFRRSFGLGLTATRANERTRHSKRAWEAAGCGAMRASGRVWASSPSFWLGAGPRLPCRSREAGVWRCAARGSPPPRHGDQAQAGW